MRIGWIKFRECRIKFRFREWIKLRDLENGLNLENVDGLNYEIEI